MVVPADNPESGTNATPISTAPNFDHLARPYRWLEYLSFGPFLELTRTHFLTELAGCRHALILGDGDGRFTARLLRANPEIQVRAVDASRKMLRSLQEKAGRYGHGVTVEVADIRDWRPETEIQYDLIVTHFFLDCLTTQEVADLAHRLIPATASDALWVVSDFAVPPSRFGRAIAAPLVAFLYHAFRLLTNLRVDRLPDHSQVLAAANWALRARHTRLWGLLVSELWSANLNTAPPGEHESLRPSRPSV